MAAAAADPTLLATDLAEHLVKARVPFREAHQIVGRIVARSVETGTPLSRFTREDLTGFHAALDIDPATFFSAERSVEARDLPGGPARKAVDRALREAREQVDAPISVSQPFTHPVYDDTTFSFLSKPMGLGYSMSLVRRSSNGKYEQCSGDYYNLAAVVASKEQDKTFKVSWGGPRYFGKRN